MVGLGAPDTLFEDEAYLRERSGLPFLQWSDEENQSMFEQPGTAYVYRIQSSVLHPTPSQRTGQEKPVLIRAIEPIQNIRRPTNGPGSCVLLLGLPETSMTDEVL